MVRRLLALASFVAPSACLAQITTTTLLREMVDFERLTRVPSPTYTLAQASSYDRASTEPGDDTWFANADWGKYLRIEERDGRKEHVMADLTGPGAVVRIWSANPAGTIRFYFDGETTPRIEAKTRDLLSGKYKFITPPFAYEALRAVNCYFPFLYEKSLKITVDDSDDNAAERMYYHVGFRSYETGTAVKSFDETALNQYHWKPVPGILDTVPIGNPEFMTNWSYKLAPGESSSITVSRGAALAITRILLTPLHPTHRDSARWSDPRRLHNVLRGLRLKVTFDGQQTVDVPVADFFGSPPSGAAYWTYPMQVDVGGTMACFFVMPFQREATITLQNDNAITAFGDLVLNYWNYDWRDDSLYFHSQWSAYRGSTRPFRDFNVLDTEGKGNYVGTTLFVANPVGEWWGEGDEKIFVDGESFPSIFGTGTEDYFGYAWSDPRPYTNIAYHAQPNAGIPGNYGLISNNRFHLLDSIPFNDSLKFDLEIWHWRETDATFAATAYWYAAPGSQGPHPLDTSLLDVPELGLKAPVEGALEGEFLKIASVTGGKTDIQGGFFETSNGQQLWWIDAKEGDSLTLEFDASEDGTYDIVANFCFAGDYGNHQIAVNGQTVGEYDFYNDGIKWDVRPLRRHQLRKGKNTLTFTVVEPNTLANPKRNMLGLDYILLQKVGA